MLVAELAGRIKVLPPPYTQPDPGLFLQITNIGSAGVQQGIYDLVLDPNFATNHYYYVFYTLGSPNHDRVSRFTANAALTGTVPGQRVRPLRGPAERRRRAPRRLAQLRQRRQAPVHDRRALHPAALAAAHQPARQGAPDQPGRHDPDRQPVLRRIGPERRLDLGPRAAQPVPRLLRRADRPLLHRRRRRQRRVHRRRGDRPRRRGRELRLAEQRGPLLAALPEPAVLLPAQRSRLPRSPAASSTTASQFPSSYDGAYFYADYTQNWIRGLRLDANGNVTDTFNFEPSDGSADGPYGDIVYLAEGPDGALYYLDLGYSDIGGTFGVSKIRRIKYVRSNQAPVVNASANPTSGADAAQRLVLERRLVRSRGPAADLLVGLRRRRHLDRGQPVAHLLDARAPIRRGSPSPTASTPRSPRRSRSAPATSRRRRSPRPTDGMQFQAGDVISYSGDGNRPRRRSPARQRLHLEHRLPPRRATFIPGHRSPACAAAASRSRPRGTTSAATPATGSR